MDPVQAPPHPHTTDSATSFGFETLARDGNARLGRLTTPHGTGLPLLSWQWGRRRQSKRSLPRRSPHGTELLFANNYHLYLPGTRCGSTRRPPPFMNHHGPILTDSGGFRSSRLVRPSSLVSVR